ncbi:hypothetical protein EV182_000156 [Spiromyces aspiralis]|uniref:Uncharacterized protein n=1 Tax=Spiromyces aspiralis TaxID=68401 RepID=A0ACC1I0W8_9FUNG|nr:hypothetical protein EV182_000156 [Spiromyces aspiralis]
MSVGSVPPSPHARAEASLYELAKCRGEFASVSKFFDRPLKAVHSSSWVYPWATQPQNIGLAGQTNDPKHRLQRTTYGDRAHDAQSQHGDSAASSVFPTNAESSLPDSVFRLPQPSNADSDGITVFKLTVGGRSLRKSSQVMLSKFD